MKAKVKKNSYNQFKQSENCFHWLIKKKSLNNIDVHVMNCLIETFQLSIKLSPKNYQDSKKLRRTIIMTDYYDKQLNWLPTGKVITWYNELYLSINQKFKW